MATVEWEDDYDDLPGKVEHYGKAFSKRFADPRCALYKPQRQALKSLEKWFSDEKKRDLTAVMVMPTGSGKTGVICCLPYFMGGAVGREDIPKEVINVDKPVLIIAPGIDILNQLYDNLVTNPFLLEKSLLREKDKKHNYTVFCIKTTADVSELKTHGYDIILSNSQKWRKNKDGTPNYEDLAEDLFSMVIVDEAHHLPAKQWEEIVKKFRGHAKIVFFTATPYRYDEREITTDGAISTQGFAYHYTQQQAIDDKLIRRVEMNQLPHPPSKRLKIDIEGLSPQRKARLFSICERMEHGREVLKEVMKCMQEKNEQLALPGGAQHASIVIARDTVEAQIVEDMCIHELDFAPDKVGLINSVIIKNPKKRKEEVDKIKNGQYKIVIIVKMLLEGFNYPPFSIAAIVTPIRSPVKFAQFIGRIRRVMRHEGDIVGDIITHEYFEQGGLYDDYIAPHIPEEENQEIDEDNDTNGQNENLPPVDGLNENSSSAMQANFVEKTEM